MVPDTILHVTDTIYKGKDAYAEKSYTDPDFCLLKFVPESGRFY